MIGTWFRGLRQVRISRWVNYTQWMLCIWRTGWEVDDFVETALWCMDEERNS